MITIFPGALISVGVFVYLIEYFHEIMLSGQTLPFGKIGGFLIQITLSPAKYLHPLPGSLTRRVFYYTYCIISYKKLYLHTNKLL